MAEQSAKDASGNGPISREVKNALRAYFEQLNGDPCCDLYQLVLEQVEQPLSLIHI